MNKYSIADIGVAIECEELNMFIEFNEFLANSQLNQDIFLRIKTSKHIHTLKGNLILNDRIKWVFADNGNTCIYVFHEPLNKNIAMLEVNKDWNNACITYLEDLDEDEYSIIESLSEIMFRNSILFHSGIVIHASVIEWEGKGILFVAPSGTGKSTQANLWKTHKNGRILNGDRAAVRMLGEHPYVYGAPWSGSSPDYLNFRAPLSAIILIEQASKNEIVKFSNYEAVSKLIPRCFLPYYDRNMMDKALNNLDHIINKTSIYMMGCKPDQEAVEMVYECVR